MAAAHNPHRRPPVIERAVIESIKTGGPATVVTLTERTGLSRWSVAPAVHRLRQKGVVVAAGYESGNGLPSQGHPRRIYAMAAAMGSQ